MIPISLTVILVAIVIAIVVGALWYGPLFGKKWMILAGIPTPTQKPTFGMMFRPMFLSAIGAAAMTFVFSFSVFFHNAYYQTTGYPSALSIAFLLWVGFVVPQHLNFVGWENKPWTLFFINTGYWLVTLLLIACTVVFFS